MSVGIQFPFRFDATALRAELDRIRPEEWSPHYNDRDYGGTWRGAALRSATGLSTDIIASGPDTSSFRPTPLLERLPAFQRVLDHFHCQLKSVRLLSLAPGSFIREHSDNALEYADGEIRIHVPIQTNSQVEFYVCGERLRFEEGGCYYVNVNLPHRVNNKGKQDRIHLVIDAQVNDWIHSVFRDQAQPIPRCDAPTDALTKFQRYILIDERLQALLREISDQSTFLATACQLAAEAGFDLTDSDLEVGFRAPAVAMTEAPALGWTPFKVIGSEAELVWTGGRRFTEPFFEDTLRACLRSPFARLFRRRVLMQEVPSSAEPAGLIFHMSRCGSTLISQMLAALESNIVISEAPAVDEVLQGGEENAVHHLRWLASVFRQKQDRRLFIKLDAWHMHRLPLIRKTFPHTPWVFVQRNPDEIMQSWNRIPGRQSVPGLMDPRALGIDPAIAAELTREEWCEKVLAGFSRAAETLREEPGGLFVDYTELPHAVTGKVAEHFQLSLTQTETEKMLNAARYDAKNPTQLFGFNLNSR